MYRFGFFLIAVIAIAAGLMVGTLNSDRVMLDLLWFQLDWPLGLLILLSLSIGLLLGLGLSFLFQVMPMRLQQRKLRQAATAPPEQEPPDADA